MDLVAGGRTDRAAGQRRAGDGARRHRSRPPRRLDGRAGPPDARAARPAVPPRRATATGCATSRTSCRTSPGRASTTAPSTSCRPTSPRCRACSRRLTRAARGGRLRRRPTATATSASAPTPTTSPASSARCRSSSRPTPQMPRTFGRNTIHHSQVAGWCEVDRPLVEVPARRPDAVDRRIAELVAERIPDGAVHPGRHRVDPERRARRARATTATSASTPSCCPTAWSTWSSAASSPACARCAAPARWSPPSPSARGGSTTSSTTTRRWSCCRVDWVNDPRVIAQEPRLRVDQRHHRGRPPRPGASETVAGRYWSGSGGQADFARGAMYSDGGQGFVVLPSTAADGRVPHRAPLHRGLGGHDAQEHRRQGRHRARRRRASGPHRRASGPAP